ncbi:stealth conserved region 3 domain-containing protein [Nocardia sp. NPDC101769]|uniref:stealth conserved region 3 domain-containing protein n=1 Tax=Nocardia sp. NPDC101769 TaxID=3364333 RepID=UPI00382750E9
MKNLMTCVPVAGGGTERTAVENLLLTRGVLLANNIRFLLIRTADGEPALALGEQFRGLVAPLLRADGGPGSIDVEFWEFGDEEVRCPRPNALTRTSFPAADLELAQIQRYGSDWVSLEGMFEPHAGDIGFPIDIVFSWVDGNDPALAARRAAAAVGVSLGEGDAAPARTRQIDELRFALRSVHEYAPWVHRIFIATDSTPPNWLADDPKVTIVRAAEHFSDPNSLPTFNSHAIETQLQHIPGLSEHFIYANDDMFFGRPVAPEMFFTSGGISRFIESDLRIGTGPNTEQRSGFENGARVNRALLRHRFGHVITRHLEHAPTPLRRSVLLEMEREFAEDFARTQASPFRSATDISVTNSLYHYYALLTGRAVRHETAWVRYVDTTTFDGLDQLGILSVRRDADFFCLNDSSFPEVEESHRASRVRCFLEHYFPRPAPWERTAALMPERAESDTVAA